MVLVGLALRLAVMAFTYTGQLDPAQDHFPFGFETGRIARSIASGQGFSSPYPLPSGPTALMTPVYPYLLAGVFELFGIYTPASALVILSLNNLFSSLTCLPVFYIARKVFAPGVASWAGWGWAVFPYSVALGNLWIWDTSLTTLLLSLLLLMTLHLGGPARLRVWLGYGLLWGFAVLTNPAVLSVMPFLWAWIGYRQRRSRARWALGMATAALVFLGTATPWLVRNHRTFGRFIFFRSNFALEFVVGNSGDTSRAESENVRPGDNPLEMEKIQRLGEIAYVADKRREAIEFLTRHPGQFSWLTVRRFVYFWTGYWGPHPSWRLDDEYGIPNIFACSGITFLALFGLYRAIRDRQEYTILLAIPLTFLPLVYYITHPDIRYRHPIDPAIVVLAAYGILSCFRGQKPELVVERASVARRPGL